MGRWLSIDPLGRKYPQLSPYNFVGNSPLLFIDPNGKEIIIHYLNDQGKAASYTFKAGVKPTTTNEFVQKAYEAITFVMGNDDSKTFQSLVSASNKVNLYYRDMDESHGETDLTGYTMNNGTIIKSADASGNLPNLDVAVYWDPNAAAKTTDGGGLSPSTILFHEAVHAKRYINVKTIKEFKQLQSDVNSRSFENLSKYGLDYHNPEEKRVVDIENAYIEKLNKSSAEYAKANGTNAQQESVRKNHKLDRNNPLYKTYNVKSIKPKDKTISIKGQQ